MGEVEDYGDKCRKRLKISHYSSQEETSNSLPKVEILQEEKNSQTEDKKSSATELNLSATEDEKSLQNCKNSSSPKGTKNEENTEDFSLLVAAHYNSMDKSNLEKRKESRIVYLRNFNNWIKSILIKDSVWQLPEQNKRNLKVLDMCCGKGGDLFKWSKFNIKYMILTDIAENSLEQFKIRFNEHIEFCQRNKRQCNLDCEFIPADCTRVRLRGKYKDPSIRFDIVSCQFSFHYCFESLPQAECMLKNASECLKPGGLFIGTIPTANEIVKRLKESKANSFKNDVFAVEMCCTEPYPLFGAKYNFYLEGVVNCPEFLVHFPTFERLAEKYGLKLVQKEKFTELFERRRKQRDGEMLLRKMKALEAYPPDTDKKSAGPSEDYIHAKILCEQNGFQQVGTLSKSEWEVVSLYQTFTFKKVETKEN